MPDYGRGRGGDGRVTTVSPWVWGGSGQFRDLFPMTPATFFVAKAIRWAFHNWFLVLLTTLLLVLTFTYDWVFEWATLLCAFLALTPTIVKASWVWYHHPDLPALARKDSDTF